MKQQIVETDLLSSIGKMRYKMIQSGLSKGFLHPDTLQLSEQLDKLLTEYQLIFKKGLNRHELNEI